MMIEVVSNPELRNVARNSLQGLSLLRDTVFFGINGSGKSTLCQVLSEPTIYKQNSSGSGGAVKVFAFNDEWRSTHVGDFIKGGSAKGVTTVRMSDAAGDIEQDIQRAEEAVSVQQEVVAQTGRDFQLAENSRKAIINSIFDGERKQLENSCIELKGNKFKRPKIEELLNSGDLKLLSPKEVEQDLRIVGEADPGELSSLPTLPTVWVPSEELWSKVFAPRLDVSAARQLVSDWAREGLERHSANDNCDFCGGVVTEKRLKDLNDAISQEESAADVFILKSRKDCEESVEAITRFKTQLEAARFESLLYREDLDSKRALLITELDGVSRDLSDIAELLKQCIQAPNTMPDSQRVVLDARSFRARFADLEKTYFVARTAIRDHKKNQERAVQRLKEHCCAKDGSGWAVAMQGLTDAESAKVQACDKLGHLQKELDSLKKTVSTTADTAEFLDKNLSMILGDNVLRISEGEEGEGYRITRRDQRAEAMSEGEKKLVSLLYFCAEFTSENRKKSISDSIVIFDDLGSELDDARLLAVDRFITNHFSDGSKPASIVYFTHSHSYLKMLISRLGGGAKTRVRKDKTIPPSSLFYEVYKDSFGGGDRNTVWRKWDEEAVQLTNDYWLSFYLVLRAFEDLRDNQYPSLGIGNYCRKVLEGFTEFKAPNSDNFGSRMDTLIKDKEIPLSPSLSKLVNHLSHSDLNRSGGVLSRNETEIGLVQTLNFMKLVDPKHFEALVKKFRKNETIDLISSLEARVNLIEPEPVLGV